MTRSTSRSVDISLWRKVKSVPYSERWKWGEEIWEPILSKLFTESAKIEDLECPVCGKKELYAHFLAVSFNIPRSVEEGRRVYLAERWFGCHACETQIRDWGEIPRWVNDKDVQWATEKKKQWAEHKLAKSKKGLKDEQDPGEAQR